MVADPANALWPRFGRGLILGRGLGRDALLAPVLAATALTAMVAATRPSTARAYLAACFVGLLLVQRAVDWRRLPVLIVLWLVPLGTVRRIVTELVGGGGLDPLLLVAPAAWAALVADTVRRRGLGGRTALTTAVLTLSALTLLGSVNTARAPLLVGIAGLLFFLVPQLAFWVGRAMSSPALVDLLKVTRILALLAGGYGTLQVFHGLLPWDRHWVLDSGYAALNVGGAIRPFGTSSSSAEYASLLGVGVVCWLTLKTASRWVTLSAVAALVVSVVVSSSRGVVALLVAALVVVAAARRGLRARTALAMTLAVLVVLPLVVGFVAPKQLDSSAASRLVQHQTEGLANPLDPSSSSLVGHVGLVGEGVRSVVAHPLGLGVGAVSIAGSRFGGPQMQTEVDASNAAVALGLPGLLAFLVILCYGLARAYKVASHSRDPVALAALGLLLVTNLQWLNGGLYGVAWLPWLLLGWLDGAGRALVPAPTAAAVDASGARPA